MDTDLQRAKRRKDPVAELVALTRMPALRGLPPCRHCGRDLSRVEVSCELCGGSGTATLRNSSASGFRVRAFECPDCNGTGRTEWPWHGDGGRLALMAYAGDEAARALLGCGSGYQCACWFCSDGAARLPGLVTGLDRWPSGARLAAGILAGRAVLPTWEGAYRGTFAAHEAPRKALDAATEHHHCGCVESREAWISGCGEVIEALGYAPRWLVSGVYGPDEAIDAAIAETDEPTIRAAICAGLTGWGRTGVL